MSSYQHRSTYRVTDTLRKVISRMDKEADNLHLLVELLDITVTLSRAIEIDGAGNPNLLREVLDFADVLNTLRKIAIVNEAAARYPL